MNELPSKEAAQLAELVYLRDVVIPHMEKPETLVYLDDFERVGECGTYRCVLGWYTWLRHGVDYCGWPGVASEVFGEVFDELFDEVPASGTLADRKAALERIIDERTAV